MRLPSSFFSYFCQLDISPLGSITPYTICKYWIWIHCCLCFFFFSNFEHLLVVYLPIPPMDKTCRVARNHLQSKTNSSFANKNVNSKWPPHSDLASVWGLSHASMRLVSLAQLLLAVRHSPSLRTSRAPPQCKLRFLARRIKLQQKISLKSLIFVAWIFLLITRNPWETSMEPYLYISMADPVFRSHLTLLLLVLLTWMVMLILMCEW